MKNNFSPASFFVFLFQRILGNKFSLILLFFTVANKNLAQQIDTRVFFPINDDWKFTVQPVSDPFRLKYNDSNWDNISIPHCWNVDDPYDDNNNYYRGIGWYRKKITIPAAYKNKRVFISFNGVNQVADVYVNGANVGRHKGGYTGFTFDITPYLQTDHSENIIAVQVNNGSDMFIPPLDVGYTIYGGIYRKVQLIFTEDVHFTMENAGSCGLFVSPEIHNKLSATLNIKGTVYNETLSEKRVEINNVVYDANHQVVSSFTSTTLAKANEGTFFVIKSPAINNPILWTPEHPYLYTIVSQIKLNGKVTDEMTNPLGFKWCKFDPDSGFFLNGNKYILKGTNRHQDKSGKGSALSDEDHEIDLQSIKNMGCNFLRLAHYPQDPYVLKRADELGLLIWEEIPLVNLINPNREFLNNCISMVKEMVRQHYNHPSILLWGSMNEIFLNDAFNNRTQKITDSSYGQEARRFAEMLDKYIRTEDSNRVSTLAMHMSSDYDKYKIDIVPEVASYNVYSGWYSGKVDEFGKTFDNKHASKPKLSIFISEYGAESDRSLNTETPIRLDNTGQYQRYFHESYLQQIKARTYLSGSAIWNQFDFGNPNIGGTMSNINHKGMYTWDRQPKDVYFFYKANWNPSPMIYIASRDWKDRAGAIGDSSTIEVYTNGKDATLLLNKKNIGTKKINSINKIKWRVVLVDGVNELIAKTKIKGEVVADTFYLNYHGYSKKIADNSSFNSLLINIGSNAQYIDNQKNIWLEDRPYKKGSFGYIGGKPSFISLKGKITNTDKTPLLYSYLDSISIYQIDVPNGQYQIELFFAEPEFHQQDKRVFNVNVNGSSVINHIDLNKEASYVEAVSKTLNVTAKDNQGIQITFDAIKGNPILNALRITRQ